MLSESKYLTGWAEVGLGSLLSASIARVFRCLSSRRALLALMAAFAVLFAQRAAAAESTKVGIYVKGTDAKSVREQIAKIAGSQAVTDDETFKRALDKIAQQDPKFDESSKLGSRVNRALKASKLDLAVVARVRKQKNTRVAHVLVFAKGETAPRAEEELDLGKRAGSSTEQSALSSTLKPLIGERPSSDSDDSSETSQESADADEGAAGKGEGEGEDESGNKGESEGGEGRRAAKKAKPAGAPKTLSIALAIGGAARKFDYNQPVTRTLRPYSVWGMGVADLSLEAYPFASSSSFASNLGLLGGVALALPFKSKVADATDQTFDTSYFAYRVGLGYRIALGASSELLISASYGGQKFDFSGGSDPLLNDLPSVKYAYVEPALDARIGLGAVRLFLGAGYRAVLSGGPLLDRFPHASVGGFAGRIGLGVPLGTGGWELRVLAAYERYFYNMHSAQGDANVAGGALDVYMSALLGLGYSF